MTLAQLLKLTPEQALRLVILLRLIDGRGLNPKVAALEAGFLTPVLAEIVKSGSLPEAEFIHDMKAQWSDLLDDWMQAEMEAEIEETEIEAETAVKN